VLMRFIKLRVIVIGPDIYPLQEKKSVVVAIPTNRTHIVATDGFHFTKPKEFSAQATVNYLKVGCAIEDDHLIAGGIITFFLYLAGFTSGVLVVLLFSFVPILYFLYLYYVSRNDFIQIQRA
jgi:hypothetical protein